VDIVVTVKRPGTGVVGLESEDIGDVLLDEDCIAASRVGASAAAPGGGDPVVEKLRLDIEPDPRELGQDLKVVAV
jgi:hypothetical protein